MNLRHIANGRPCKLRCLFIALTPLRLVVSHRKEIFDSARLMSMKAQTGFATTAHGSGVGRSRDFPLRCGFDESHYAAPSILPEMHRRCWYFICPKNRYRLIIHAEIFGNFTLHNLLTPLFQCFTKAIGYVPRPSHCVNPVILFEKLKCKIIWLIPLQQFDFHK